MTHEDLRSHSFTQAVFATVRPVMRQEYNYRKKHGRKAEYIPNEHEFYLLRVGNRLSIILAHCEQLSHAILFISNYRHTPVMNKAGVTRTKHLRYSIENFVIRAHSIYDLALKLVDATFHLTNAPAQCRHDTIVNNHKVARSNIPNQLKRLRKHINTFTESRNTIIHHGAYQEQDLYHLELNSELIEDYRRTGQSIPDNMDFLPDAQKELTLKVIADHKKKYTEFNSIACDAISELFDGLSSHFLKMNYTFIQTAGIGAQQ